MITNYDYIHDYIHDCIHVKTGERPLTNDLKRGMPKC